jgi:hypothetical protein
MADRVSIRRAGEMPVNPVPVVKYPMTSTRTSVDPKALNNDTRPPVPSPSTTMFAVVRPATILRFDDSGRVPPAGHAVRYPVAVGLVAVTLSATATASAGTPPTPATTSSRCSAAAKAPPPARVSITRAGVIPTKPGPNHPVASTTISAVPEPLNTLIEPPVPRPTMTRLATVCPGRKFTFDVPGCADPVGHTVT